MADLNRPSPSPGSERRQHTRVAAADLPFRLQESRGPLKIRDLSRSGISFYSESPIPVMTQVRFAFELTSGGNAQVASGEGAVVRCERISPALDHYEVALFFTDLDAPAREFLGLFIAQRARQSH